MKKIIKKIIVKLNLINLLSILLYIIRIFPIKNNKIFCQNFTSGKGFGDSPKYIVLELLKDKGKYDIVWAVKNIDYSSIPKEVKLVKIYSLRYFYELATSKVWINNTRFPQFVKKRKKQYYVQTWHSPLRMKKIELDAKENLSEYYLKCIKNDSKMIDIILCGCDFSYNIYRNSFMYDGKILKSGTPRCDNFFDEKIKNQSKEKILKRYKIKTNKKIILYAPTFRKRKCNYLLDYEKVIQNIGDNYIFLIRSHPSEKIDFIEKEDIINVSDYPDMQELINCSDILITDYSSCSFDMLIANKPCYLFIKDLEDYLENERGLYFNFEELPFIICKNEQELILQIENFNLELYTKKINSFKNKIGLYEHGNSCKIVKDIINKVCFYDEKYLSNDYEVRK